MQEALLRVHQALDRGEQIASPRAFVATLTARLAINELRSARARRERYAGEWLPELIITGGHDDPAGPSPPVLPDASQPSNFLVTHSLSRHGDISG